MTIDVTDVVFAVTWPPAFSAIMVAWDLHRGRGRDYALRWLPLSWLIAAVVVGGDGVAGHDWLVVFIALAQAGIGLWLWWRNRRKDRKRALAALGYKALVAKAALVRKAREAAKPRPVLRPVPGGVR